MAKHREGQDQQRCVVIRVDVVVYVLLAVIAVLAFASVVWPERVELTLVGSLGTLMAGLVGGWLTFMRLCRTPPDDEDDPGDDET